MKVEKAIVKLAKSWELTKEECIQVVDEYAPRMVGYVDMYYNRISPCGNITELKKEAPGFERFLNACYGELKHIYASKLLIPEENLAPRYDGTEESILMYLVYLGSDMPLTEVRELIPDYIKSLYPANEMDQLWHTVADHLQ